MGMKTGWLASFEGNKTGSQLSNNSPEKCQTSGGIYFGSEDHLSQKPVFTPHFVQPSGNLLMGTCEDKRNPLCLVYYESAISRTPTDMVT